MTQVLLPSSVGLLNGRLWPTKVQFKNVGKDLYHLRESSRQLRLLHQDLFVDINGCHVENQIKHFIKLEAKDDKKIDLNHLKDVAVTMKQDAKLCTRVNHNSSSSNESMKRCSRSACSTDEKSESRNACVTSNPSADDLLVIDNRKECSNGGQQTVKTSTNQCRKRRSEKRSCPEADKCESIERRSTRQAMLREQQADKQSVKKDTTEDAVNSIQESSLCSSKKLEIVAVPTWRIIHVLKLYKLENTENLTDESYLKRHQRLEADEKRRKRWDLQRQRELSAYESARVALSDASNSNPPPASPSLSESIEVAYVEVLDDPSASVDPPRSKLRRKKFAHSSNVEHINKTPLSVHHRQSLNRRRGRTRRNRRR